MHRQQREIQWGVVLTAAHTPAKHHVLASAVADAIKYVRILVITTVEELVKTHVVVLAKVVAVVIANSLAGYGVGIIMCDTHPIFE